MKLIIQLTQVILPIIVFIFADMIFGTKVGLIIAISFGLLEFIISSLKKRSVDKFILLDLFLLSVLGGVSIILENDIFFRIKPAVIEAIFVILLGISAFSNSPYLLLMAKRYVKGIEFNEIQIMNFRSMMKQFFFLFLFHIILIIFSAFYCNVKIWGFISGILIYIFIGILFLFQIIKRKYFKNTEMFEVFDNNGKKLGLATRAQCHSNKNLIHRVVHLIVLNSRGELCLQKRAENKDIQPGKWDISVGGHVQVGEKPDDAVLREAKEELGMDNFQCKFCYSYINRTDVETELVYTYSVVYDKPLSWDKNEISEIRFWKISDIRSQTGKKIFTPNFEEELRYAINAGIINAKG